MENITMSNRNRKNRKQNEVVAIVTDEQVVDSTEVTTEQDVHSEMAPTPDSTEVLDSTDTSTNDVGSVSEVLESMSEGIDVGEPETVTQPVVDEPTVEKSNVISMDPFASVPAPDQDKGDNEPITTVTKTRRAKIEATAVITLLSESNPKKPGSQAHSRFANYKTGMTVEAALKSGLRRDDLNWDSARNFISIEAA